MKTTLAKITVFTLIAEAVLLYAPLILQHDFPFYMAVWVISLLLNLALIIAQFMHTQKLYKWYITGLLFVPLSPLILVFIFAFTGYIEC